MATKYVYMFTEGNASMRNLLGGKGAGLAEMTGLGLPVPQGFTITTEACTKYYEDGRQINEEIMDQIREGIDKMEQMGAWWRPTHYILITYGPHRVVSVQPDNEEAFIAEIRKRQKRSRTHPQRPRQDGGVPAAPRAKTR